MPCVLVKPMLMSSTLIIYIMSFLQKHDHVQQMHIYIMSSFKEAVAPPYRSICNVKVVRY